MRTVGIISDSFTVAQGQHLGISVTDSIMDFVVQGKGCA